MEQSDDQGLIYTLMLVEGHPLIYLQTAACHIVVQMSGGKFEQADCSLLSQAFRSHTVLTMQCS